LNHTCILRISAESEFGCTCFAAESEFGGTCFAAESEFGGTVYDKGPEAMMLRAFDF